MSAADAVWIHTTEWGLASGCREPAGFGLARRWGRSGTEAEGPRFDSASAQKVVVHGHSVVTLESLKHWNGSPSLPILMQESFWWWQCIQRYWGIWPPNQCEAEGFPTLSVKHDQNWYKRYLKKDKSLIRWYKTTVHILWHLTFAYTSVEHKHKAHAK